MKLKSILSSILVGTLGMSMMITTSQPIKVHANEKKSDNGIFQFSSGFSETQGQNNWYYKENVYGNYSDMSFSNGIWSGSHVWSRIYRPASIHPGPTQDAVLAFKAPRDGNIVINGNVKKELGGGNGVKVQIKHNNNKIWPLDSEWQEISSHDFTGYDHEISLTVKEGDYIYFSVNNNGSGNISADNTSWNPVIIYDDAEIEAGLMGGFASKDKHYMQEDFYGIRYEVIDKLWQVSAWKNEKLSTEIVLTSDEALTGLNLESSDLVDENGNTIDSNNVELNFMDYVLAEGAMMPDIIDIAESVDMTDKGVQPIWVTIKVPENAEAGKYTGTIKANSSDGKSVEFNVNLEVLDIVLPSPDDWSFHLDLWQNPYSVARYYDVPVWSEKHMELLKPHLERLQQAGQKVITTTIVKDPWNNQTYDAYGSMVDWTKKSDGTFEFDFTNFDKYVELCLEVGIDKQINCYTMVPWENRIFYYDESLGKEVQETLAPGSAKWNEYWGQFIDELVAHVEEKGWTDKTYIAMDERPVYTMEAVFDLLEGTPLKVSGAMNYAGVGGLVDKVDDMSMAIHHVNDSFEEIIDHRKELGHNTTYYVCTGLYPNTFTKRSLPSEAAWLGWYAAKVNADGFLKWAYDSWVENPLETTDHVNFESGDCFVVYPERSSIRFERLIEGVQDNEKMRYIDENYSEWSLEVDKILEGLQRGYYSGDGVDLGVEVNEAKKELEDLTKKIINGEEPPRGEVNGRIECEAIVEAGKTFDYSLNLSGLVGMNGLNAILTYNPESISIAKVEEDISMVLNKKLEIVELNEFESGKLSIKLQAKEGETLTSDDAEIFKLSFESLEKNINEIILSDIEVLFKNGSPVLLENLESNIKVVSENIAKGKSATASSSEASYGRGPEKGNDGDGSTRWCAGNGNANQWWQVDLGEKSNIEGIKIDWEKAAGYGFRLKVSDDGSNWKTVYDNAGNIETTNESLINLNESNVRYVKFESHTLPNSSTWVSFFELKVFGEVQGNEGDGLKESLKELIDETKNLADISIEGIENGNYHVGSIEDLRDSITEAEEVYNDNTANVELIQVTINNLEDAIAKFERLVITETTGDVNDDGIINLGDLAIVSKYQGKVNEDNNFSLRSDLNIDWVVDRYEIEFISKRVLK